MEIQLSSFRLPKMYDKCKALKEGNGDMLSTCPPSQLDLTVTLKLELL